MSITDMVKVCTVRIKLPKELSQYIQLVSGRKIFLIIAFVKLLITLEHNDIFTSNKDYLTLYSQTIHLLPRLTNLVDQQMRQRLK